ncbi:MAG: VOC family protein [Caldilineaceae bacterium]|nr:VOC family protein [Caldilineaceae bacterium]
MAHPIVHIELSAHDHQEAAKWYADLFGWPTQEFPDMNYTTFMSGEGAVGGGFNPVTEQFHAGTVTFYIQTDDLDDHLTRIEAAGGKIAMSGMDVPTVGRLGFFIDPTGNLIGLLQPEMSDE